jgi:hypothetical protein
MDIGHAIEDYSAHDFEVLEVAHDADSGALHQDVALSQQF